MSIKVEKDGIVETGAAEAAAAIDEDMECVAKAKGGDQEAYEELVLRHQKRAFNVAYRILGDYDEALDTTQEAFIQAWRALGKFRGESRFIYWLLTITANLCRNRLKHWKRRARNRTSSLDEPIKTEDSEVTRQIADPSPGAPKVLESKETEALVRNELSKLDEEYRTVLVLRELQELRYDEIAAILGIAVGTVKSRLHRGRLLLGDRLRKRPELADGEF